MLVCLFIVVWLLRAFKLLRFPSFSCKNADFYTKNGRVNFGGFSGLPEQNYEVLFCLLWQFGLFLTYTKRNEVLVSFFKLSSFWLMKAWSDNCCTYIYTSGTKFWKTAHSELPSEMFTELRRLLRRLTSRFKKLFLRTKAQFFFCFSRTNITNFWIKMHQSLYESTSCNSYHH